MITHDLLIGMGARVVDVDKYGDSLIQECQHIEVNTPLRVAHFLGQVFHESGNLRYVEENLNYSVTGLLKIFPKYFNQLEAERYARNPQMIASRVYADRMGNGPEHTGDGWRYRGRGLIQVTGKENYRRLGSWVNRDLVARPELVATEFAATSAAWYWSYTGLNRYADADDLREITRRINGGFNGLDARRKLVEYAKYELSKGDYNAR